MLQIRREQMAAFSGAAWRDFERRMVVHLNDSFPTVCAPLGEAGVRENIGYGRERAATYGITSERDVCKYIDFMFVFGRDFDQDRGLPWAGSILKDARFADASARMEALSAAGQAHLHALANTPAQQP